MGNSCLNFTCKYIKIEIEMKSCRMQESIRKIPAQSIRKIPAQSMSCFNSFLYSDWLSLANSSFEQQMHLRSSSQRCVPEMTTLGISALTDII